jgi:hypothetical protein
MPDTVSPAKPAQAPPVQPVQRGELERVPGTRAQRHARGQACAPDASTSRVRRITRALTRRLDPYLALLSTILGGVLILAALLGLTLGRLDRTLDQLTASQACTQARAQVTAAYDTARATEGAAALHEKAEEALLYQAGRMKLVCP